MPLYSVVRLKSTGQKFVVKSAFIDGMKSAVTTKHGCRPTKQRKIFFAPNPNEPPQFVADIRTEFDGTKTACYIGFVIKTFGKTYIRYLIDV